MLFLPFLSFGERTRFQTQFVSLRALGKPSFHIQTALRCLLLRGLSMILGAHQSIREEFLSAVERAARDGCASRQIFSKTPAHIHFLNR
jgi:hypothetical protein